MEGVEKHRVEGVEKRYYTIGEAARELGVKPSVLRFWEQEFEQLKVQKSAGGRRVYSRKQMELLKKIHFLLRDMKYTIKGAKEKLESQRVSKDEKTQLRETLQEVKVFLESLLQTL
ncbi:MAG: MerR family transcriptional regulator [Bacteroidia bacterium]|nr:MerR family transcriptional regulator [Bacteroidia bacterium]MDW8333269.1 MerR family transcriptional regulator [Bacteroidia bacterium]